MAADRSLAVSAPFPHRCSSSAVHPTPTNRFLISASSHTSSPLLFASFNTSATNLTLDPTFFWPAGHTSPVYNPFKLDPRAACSLMWPAGQVSVLDQCTPCGPRAKYCVCRPLAYTKYLTCFGPRAAWVPVKNPFKLGPRAACSLMWPAGPIPVLDQCTPCGPRAKYCVCRPLAYTKYLT